ncbi:MAG: homogentisate 1,2-dioxygenase [Betaproteobacteria bacterium]|nr:homogentisate 1,2-dioxygenase [Betaproteobacteria bacterium]MBI3057453.1 homogentisate 1,2-dioxygenase [Betaproteobacteria bacterium]
MTRKWIALPRVEGIASRQAHADLPPGAYERELGREGFYGPSTQMVHRHPPTGWSAFDGPLRPRAFDTAKLAGTCASPWDAVPILANDHLRLRVWHTSGAMDHLVRNGDGDELLFVHQGAGQLFCDYGHLEFRDGDYVLLPRGTLWRVETGGPLELLLIEATNDSCRLPEKGIAGEHAVFDAAAFDVPAIDDAFRAQQTEREWRVAIKRRGALSVQTFPFNPLDALGWHGTLMPVRLNWRDLRPLMSHRAHLPPSAHTTFAAARFVVCTFCPRPLESDPGALKVPFFHNNDDYDEVIFYHRGEFVSRDNIRPGMITLHPSGFTHGPHPKALRAGAEGARKETDEVAVMIDARDALDVAVLPDGIEWIDYVNSWKDAENPAGRGGSKD